MQVGALSLSAVDLLLLLLLKSIFLILNLRGWLVLHVFRIGYIYAKINILMSYIYIEVYFHQLE